MKGKTEKGQQALRAGRPWFSCQLRRNKFGSSAKTVLHFFVRSDNNKGTQHGKVEEGFTQNEAEAREGCGHCSQEEGRCHLCLLVSYNNAFVVLEMKIYIYIYTNGGFFPYA